METQNQFKFFIVDDDFFCATVYEQYLSNMNYKDVSYYSNGTDCINNLNQNPDIIFLDHNMEDFNGFEVLKRIKKYNPNIYVVMISGQENSKTATDALKFGAFDYVLKDRQVCEKMGVVIKRIIKVQEELTKSNFNTVKQPKS